MAVVTVSQEITSPVSAPRFFKAMAFERHILIPKLLPHAFKSVEVVKGDGGVGSVTKTTFADGTPFKYMMQRTDEIDTEKFYCKYTIFEGDMLKEFESISNEATFVPSGEGCIVKATSHHYPKPGAVVDEEGVKKGKEQAFAMFKKVEEYLLANPDVYA